MNGAIFTETQPATIITSACLGVAQNMTPKRSRSKRDAAVAIISIAQQERPNVRLQRELLRAHCASRSKGATRRAPAPVATRQESTSFWLRGFSLIPIPALPAATRRPDRL